MKASAHKKSSKEKKDEKGKELTKEEKKNIIQQLDELEKDLQAIKTNMENEQQVIVQKVKATTQNTRNSDLSILDDTSEINETFTNYCQMYEKKIVIKTKYYELKNSLSQEQKNKGFLMIYEINL
jgi:phosphopantothenoylcysteine synthetase/decarboxylase